MKLGGREWPVAVAIKLSRLMLIVSAIILRRRKAQEVEMLDKIGRVRISFLAKRSESRDLRMRDPSNGRYVAHLQHMS